MAESGKLRFQAFKNRGRDKDELRRRRNVQTVELRKSRRDECLLKRRNVDDESNPESVLHDFEGGNGQLGDLITTADGTQVGPIDFKNIASLAESARSPNIELRLQAVKSARKLLSMEKTPPIDDMIRGGMLPVLIECLTVDNEQIQFEATWALTNVASGTSEQTQAVVNAGAVPHFIELLKSPNPNVTDQAVWALGNIIGDGPKLRDYCIQLNIFEPLLALLDPNRKLNVCFVRNIAWVLVNFCRCKDPPPSDSSIQQILPALVHLLNFEDSPIITDATWALAYLADTGNAKIQMIIEIGAVPKVIPMLDHSEHFVQTAALRCIGNIVTGNDEQTQVILDNKALDYFPKLLVNASPKIQKEAIWFLSNVTAGNQQQIQTVIDSGVLPIVITHLSRGEFVLQKEAAWTITNLTVNGSKSQIEYLLNHGIIEAMCHQLKVTDPSFIQILLDGLTNILKSSNDSSITNEIETCGGLDLIEQLQEHENEEIYRLAYDIIVNYFSDDGNDESLAPGQVGDELLFRPNCSENTEFKF